MALYIQVIRHLFRLFLLNRGNQRFSPILLNALFCKIGSKGLKYPYTYHYISRTQDHYIDSRYLNTFLKWSDLDFLVNLQAKHWHQTTQVLLKSGFSILFDTRGTIIPLYFQNHSAWRKAYSDQAICAHCKSKSGFRCRVLCISKS